MAKEMASSYTGTAREQRPSSPLVTMLPTASGSTMTAKVTSAAAPSFHARGVMYSHLYRSSPFSSLFSSPELSPAPQSLSGTLYTTRPTIWSRPVAFLACRADAIARSTSPSDAMLDIQKKPPVPWMACTLAALTWSLRLAKASYTGSSLAAYRGLTASFLCVNGLLSARPGAAEFGDFSDDASPPRRQRTWSAPKREASTTAAAPARRAVSRAQRCMTRRRCTAIRKA